MGRHLVAEDEHAADDHAGPASARVAVDEDFLAELHLCVDESGAFEEVGELDGFEVFPMQVEGGDAVC